MIQTWLHPAIIIASIICLLAISFTVWMYGLNLRKMRLRPARKPMEYNHQLIQAFSDWLFQNIGVIMNDYLEKRTGAERTKLDELTLDKEFTTDCIQFISTEVTVIIPAYYQSYMVQFYGYDKFADVIYSTARRVTVQFVNQQLEKRRRENNNR